jgi:acyl-coenzyme A synthetase/AMP-(fatty) acid ligase
MTATSPLDIIGDTVGAVGVLNPGISVEIVNDEGVVLPLGNEGVVRVMSPYAVDHYLGDLEASKRSFRDGWFYPGDIGTLGVDNVLQIRGRRDAVLNLGGDKISAESLEAAVASLDGVAECAVFSIPNSFGNQELIAALVTNKMIDDAKLHSHCAAHMPAHFIPTRFVRVAVLPRNAMGKIDRKSLPILIATPNAKSRS